MFYRNERRNLKTQHAPERSEHLSFSEITRIRREISFTLQTTYDFILNYVRYVPRAVYNVMEDEVKFLKQQLQSHSSVQLEHHVATGWEKVKQEVSFLRNVIDEV